MCANKCHVYLTLCNAKVSIQRFTSYFFVSKVRVLPLFLLVNGMKKILIYSQWILNTYNGKVLHYFLLWALFVNTFIKCKHLVGRNGRPKQESDQANVSRVPDVAKGYPILLTVTSVTLTSTSLVSVPDRVGCSRKLDFLSIPGGKYDKNHKNIKADLLVYRSKFFFGEKRMRRKKERIYSLRNTIPHFYMLWKLPKRSYGQSIPFLERLSSSAVISNLEKRSTLRQCIAHFLT